jgi:thiaminase/transcriptional activator TenA
MLRRELLSLIAAQVEVYRTRGWFTTELWASILDIYGKTLKHPFLAGLRDGTLPRSKFQYYLAQDALYLTAYSKALRLLAAKAPKKEWAAQFEKDAGEAITAERQLHESLLGGFKHAEMAPVNYAYTNHLLVACGQGTFAEGLAAMLPCYWIYWEVGKELKKGGSANKDYQRWIDQYADPEYGKTVMRVFDVMNETAKGLDAAAKERCKKLFVVSSRYEYQFWDMAWREERWMP